MAYCPGKLPHSSSDTRAITRGGERELVITANMVGMASIDTTCIWAMMSNVGGSER
jgi:hypothetical protein